ncbi:PadR family transcriptional regulator [Candidatus Acidianus copahuensis]|uniref:PadR family transcriptional regulator n=1 Tax=Candidatus Acidianus copahuensis TaxID=1160895 RepID=A0A031LLM1_9CREN|nr:PadR family transcriptional regulator [Candidatus Acidianus copahuensis]EZQ01788.1 PadR family transcriptional regulator [Candidatus Acidianus copahuensis]
MHRAFGHKRGLRFLILTSLREGPKNGVEIMKYIEGISMGGWSPSPGSLYPMLGILREENLIRKRDDGKYELTEEGKQIVGTFGGFHGLQRNTVDELEFYVEYLEDLRNRDPEKFNELKEKVKLLGERLMRLGLE